MDKVPNWNEYFMQIAKVVSIRSKDPMTKVGSVIVDNNKHIIGTGYNGFPPGYPETPEMWQRPTKYSIVVHSEVCAIINCTKSCKGATLYTSLFPCDNCAKIIAGAGIKEVYYLDDKYKNDLTLDIFSKCQIPITKL